MIQKTASLLTSKYYSQQRLFNKLLLSLILARQEQKLLARSGKFTCRATFLLPWASGQVLALNTVPLTIIQSCFAQPCPAVASSGCQEKKKLPKCAVDN